MFGFTSRKSRSRRTIETLDLSRQWDITLLSGKRYINVIITNMDEQFVFVYNMKIPGCEELGGERSWYIPLSDIQSITEPPEREACLCSTLGIVDSYPGDYCMMYLSPEERKQYGAILMDDLWGLMSTEGIEHIRIYGVDATIWISLDPLGRIHMRHITISFGVRTYCILEDA